MSELKPCPFCGGEAELDRLQTYRALQGGEVGNRAAVYCLTCVADMGLCYADVPGISQEDIVNEMIDLWNRRVSEADLKAKLEKAKGALETIAAPALLSLSTNNAISMRNTAREAIKELSE